MNVVNLTALVDARAKMTPGEWWIAGQGGSMHVGDGTYLTSTELQVADDVGLVATHNAADVLIEVVRAALAHRAAEVERDEAYSQWVRTPATDERHTKAVREAVERRREYLSALAKVSL